MDMGGFEISEETRRIGERWLLICDLVGGFVGAVVAVAVLLALLT